MLKNPINSIKEKVTQYIQLKFELFRLEVIERMANVMGYFAFVFITIFLLFTFGIFLFLGIAECFTTLFGSAVWGYLATALVILVITFVTGAFSKKIIRFFAGKMAELLTKNYHENEEIEDDEPKQN